MRSPRLAFALPANAQDFPTRPVRFIVPFSTGGATDTLARALGRKLNDVWGQPVVVENRQGAAGNIGMEILSKATPDGYTLAIVNSSLAINPSVFRKIAFDIERDFTHIALLGHTPSMLVAHPSVNVASVKELTDLARANPGKFSYGSCGSGTPQHFAAELYRSLANVNIVHVPYKGCAPALIDVLGGQIAIGMINGSLVAPHVKSGKLRGLAMTSRSRSRAAPDVPTFAEAGYKDFEMSSWYGMTAPQRRARARHPENFCRYHERDERPGAARAPAVVRRGGHARFRRRNDDTHRRGRRQICGAGEAGQHQGRLGGDA